MERLAPRSRRGGIGYSDKIGWTHTDNTIQNTNLYELTLDALGFYNFGGIPLPLQHRTDTIKVRQADGALISQRIDIYESVHGPLVAPNGNKVLALRVAGLNQPSVVSQLCSLPRPSIPANGRPQTAFHVKAESDGQIWKVTIFHEDEIAVVDALRCGDAVALTGNLDVHPEEDRLGRRRIAYCVVAKQLLLLRSRSAAKAAAYLEPLIISVDSRDRCGGGDDLDIETNYSAGFAGAALKSHEYQGTGLLVIRYDGKASLNRRHWNQFAIGRDRSMLDFWRGRNRRGALAIWRISCVAQVGTPLRRIPRLAMGSTDNEGDSHHRRFIDDLFCRIGCFAEDDSDLCRR